LREEDLSKGSSSDLLLDLVLCNSGALGDRVVVLNVVSVAVVEFLGFLHLYYLIVIIGFCKNDISLAIV
jgi:hypothetical protein